MGVCRTDKRHRGADYDPAWDGSRARNDQDDLRLGRADPSDADRKGSRPSQDRLERCRCARSSGSAYVQAMRTPEAAGQRFLGVGDFLWMADMAKLLRDSLGQQASKVPTRHLPDFVLRIAALFQYEARFMAPMLEQRTQYDVSKAATLLNWHPRPASEVVLACASDLLRQHLV